MRSILEGEGVVLQGGGECAALRGYAVLGEGWVVDCVVLWVLLLCLESGRPIPSHPPYNKDSRPCVVSRGAIAL
jgi:hypothetical protein